MATGHGSRRFGRRDVYLECDLLLTGYLRVRLAEGEDADHLPTGAEIVDMKSANLRSLWQLLQPTAFAK